MTQIAESTRRYKVHARHTDHHHARFVEEASFEAAAVAYLEHFDQPTPTDGNGEIHIIVHDLGTGREHCFTVDLQTADANPCG